jgi:predicted dehydrogenase
LSHPTHRRDFLRKSALAGAGAWMIGRDLFAKGSPNEALNVGIIGAKGQGGGNLNSVAEIDGVNIVALCDIDDHRLADPAGRFPKAKTYNDFRKLLDEEKGLDAVVVSTPDHTHAVATVMALKRGKHVYCEKPLTHDVAEARAVAKAAAEAKVATQMGNAAHSSDAYRRTVELVRSGAIGKVSEVHVWTNRPAGWWPQGVGRPKDNPDCPKHVHWDLWLGPAPERPYNPAYHPFAWRGRWDFGTGALGDMGCHIFDPSFWALDLGYPRLIEAGSPPVNDESPPLWSAIRYEFPAKGDRGAVTLTWYDGKRLPPAELWQPDGLTLAPDGGTIFVGEKGKRLYVGHVTEPRLLPEKEFKDFEAPKDTLPRSIGHHREWVKACKAGGETGTNFQYAAALTEAVLLGNVALRAGKVLEYDGDAMRFTNDSDANQYLRREYRKGWSLG